MGTQGLTLDIDLIANRPEVVVSHLKARRADEEQIKSVDRIGGILRLVGPVTQLNNSRSRTSLFVVCVCVCVCAVLAKERSALIQSVDKARSARKQYSQQVFELMQAKQEEQANELKAQVENVNKVG